MTGKWKTEDINCIKEHLDNIGRELVQLRKAIDHDKNQKAWAQLMELSDEISERWEEPAAVEEIRSQREN